MSIPLGPLLSLENDHRYSICLLHQEKTELWLEVGEQRIAFECVAATYSQHFYRAEWQQEIPEQAQSIRYRILEGGQPLSNQHGQSEWQFYVPGASETPRISFCSCNGFVTRKDRKSQAKHYALWEQLRQQHAEKPFAMLLMGGDQIYADEMSESPLTPLMKHWFSLPEQAQIKAQPPKELEAELERFFERVYIQNWGTSRIESEILASIPTVMMWDDHDIIDGWGSWPDDYQACDYMQAIYRTARRYFEWLQIGSRKNDALINTDSCGYSLGIRFRNTLILALDNRSQRTQDQVMAPEHWRDAIDWLHSHGGPADHALIMSAVPMVYREFEFVERFFRWALKLAGLEDDVRDHWRSLEHHEERDHFLKVLFEQVDHFKTLSVLSGDVHVGGLGVVKLDPSDAHPIYQIISSAMVNRPPSPIEWSLIRLLSGDGNEKGVIDGQSYHAHMVRLFKRAEFLRARNYVVIEPQPDHLQLHWQTEKRSYHYRTGEPE